MSTASTRSWSGLSAQPQRYIIHRKDGLIQVILFRLNGATKRPVAKAGSAISGGYAWYTVMVLLVYTPRTWRSGTLTARYSPSSRRRTTTAASAAVPPGGPT